MEQAGYDLPQGDRMTRSIVICGNQDLLGYSTSTVCARCGASIVVSPGTLKDAGADAETVCLSCGVGVIERGEAVFGGIGPNQAREVKRS